MLASGDPPSEPPTAYRYPPRLATPTPSLGVDMEHICCHLLVLGLYLQEIKLQVTKPRQRFFVPLYK